MSKIEDYRGTLKKLDDWIPFLRKNSGLPGPRGNLELAHAVAHEGSKRQFEQFLATPAEENTPEVFLVFCGLVGLANWQRTNQDYLTDYASMHPIGAGAFVKPSQPGCNWPVIRT